MSNQTIRNTDFIARPSSAEIEKAILIVNSRAAAKKRPRISKYRKLIPTIFALREAGTSLRDACQLLRELHGFEGSASGLCRFIQGYPLLQSKPRVRDFDGGL